MQNYATVVPLSRRLSWKYFYTSLRYRQFQLRDITLHIARMPQVHIQKYIVWSKRYVSPLTLLKL